MSAVLTNALTLATDKYLSVFAGFVSTFQSWGQGLFYGLLAINFTWMCIWYAFDKQSFQDSLSDFLKQFFYILLFYTIMVNHSWLVQLLQSVNTMGGQLTGQPTDPSSVVGNGIALANKIIAPVQSLNIFKITFGAIIILGCYVVIIFCFLTIALNLSLTLIEATALITVSTFLLGFGALKTTAGIARKALDTFLAKCIKLLGLYMVIAAGDQTITYVANLIPQTETTFDDYVWLLSVVILFWLLAKNLPELLANVITFVRESHGHDTAGMTLAVLSTANSIKSLLTRQNTTSSTLPPSGDPGKGGGSDGGSLGSKDPATQSGGIGAKGKAGQQNPSASGNPLSDSFRDVSSKNSGKAEDSSVVQRAKDHPVSEPRGYSAQPSSSGREAAAPSNTCSKPSSPQFNFR